MEEEEEEEEEGMCERPGGRALDFNSDLHYLCFASGFVLHLSDLTWTDL